jgi:hypothetical protein
MQQRVHRSDPEERAEVSDSNLALDYLPAGKNVIILKDSVRPTVTDDAQLITNLDD